MSRKFYVLCGDKKELTKKIKSHEVIGDGETIIGIHSAKSLNPMGDLENSNNILSDDYKAFNKELSDAGFVAVPLLSKPSKWKIGNAANGNDVCTASDLVPKIKKVNKETQDKEKDIERSLGDIEGASVLGAIVLVRPSFKPDNDMIKKKSFLILKKEFATMMQKMFSAPKEGHWRTFSQELKDHDKENNSPLILLKNDTFIDDTQRYEKKHPCVTQAGSAPVTPPSTPPSGVRKKIRKDSNSAQVSRRGGSRPSSGTSARVAKIFQPNGSKQEIPVKKERANLPKEQKKSPPPNSLGNKSNLPPLDLPGNKSNLPPLNPQQ